MHCLRERPKAGKGRDQGGSGQNKHRKMEEDKRGTLHIRRKSVNSVAWCSLTIAVRPVFLLNSIPNYFLCEPALWSACVAYASELQARLVGKQNKRCGDISWRNPWRLSLGSNPWKQNPALCAACVYVGKAVSVLPVLICLVPVTSVQCLCECTYLKIVLNLTSGWI